jgi:hypothetical protein
MAVRGGWSAEEQFIKVAAQHFEETQDMVFIYPPPPGLDVRHDLTRHVRLGELQFGGQLLLRQPPAQAELGQVRADIVGPALHGKISSRLILRAGGRALSSATKFLTGWKKFGSRLNVKANRLPDSIVAPRIIAPALIETGLRLARRETQFHSEPRVSPESNRNHCSGGGGVRSTQPTKSKEFLIAYLWQNCP